MKATRVFISCAGIVLSIFIFAVLASVGPDPLDGRWWQGMNLPKSVAPLESADFGI